MPMSDIWQVMRSWKDPAQPFLTVISPDSRIELSMTTFTNNVSKAANALRDVLDLEPGDSVAIELGCTWQHSVWQTAALIAGLDVVKPEKSPDIVVTPLLVSVHPLGVPQGGADEITSEVLGQPDAWLYPQAYPEQGDLLLVAKAWALSRGAQPGQRLGVRCTGFCALQSRVLAPLAIGGSVVIAPDFDSAILTQERIDRVIENPDV